MWCTCLSLERSLQGLVQPSSNALHVDCTRRAPSLLVAKVVDSVKSRCRTCPCAGSLVDRSLADQLISAVRMDTLDRIAQCTDITRVSIGCMTALRGDRCDTAQATLSSTKPDSVLCTPGRVQEKRRNRVVRGRAANQPPKPHSLVATAPISWRTSTAVTGRHN